MELRINFLPELHTLQTRNHQGTIDPRLSTADYRFVDVLIDLLPYSVTPITTAVGDSGAL